MEDIITVYNYRNSEIEQILIKQHYNLISKIKFLYANPRLILIVHFVTVNENNDLFCVRASYHIQFCHFKLNYTLYEGILKGS